MGDRRRFNGHNFHLYVVTFPGSAKNIAKVERSRGYLIRLEKTADGKDRKVWRSDSKNLRKRK